MDSHGPTSREPTRPGDGLRLRLAVRGAVQGVGFRPFVYRLAMEMGLTGWVRNSAQGVFIEVEGREGELARFRRRVERETPPRSFIQSLESSFLDPVGYPTFEVLESDDGGGKTALILPDVATCPDCLREILDPSNRRYRYPFTNCTNCGPRFTIIGALPYDRPNTTMRDFPMCGECRSEYENPLDRRFHAQPNACARCGPHLELWDGEATVLTTHDEALVEAAAAIRRGAVVAVKGLGGFHLTVEAGNRDAVLRLRERKNREEKPFALMYPSMDWVRDHCEVSDLEERLLVSPESPIVLLRRKRVGPRRFQDVVPEVAPGNPFLGVMLPYTPLHILLMREIGAPVVATSGNLSDEPIATDERQALQRLRGIAELFLVHNRPIARHADDSIVRVVSGREMVLRRARGYAPLPVHLKDPVKPVLAVGAHLKNTIAFSLGTEVFISQHVGDLDTPQALDAFHRVVASFGDLYGRIAENVACDLHPDYLSTRFAEDTDGRPVRVQHHYAHVLSCMAENEVEGPVLGISWDGTGYGTDGTVWGGEFLRVTEAAFERVGHLRTFRLPGGEKAVREPARSAVGLLYEVLGPGLFSMKDVESLRQFSQEDRSILRRMLERRINSPRTSSAGRLFDAVASITGLRHRVRFEGQAAMELEFALDGVTTEEAYSFEIKPAGAGLVVDWEPAIRKILDGVRCGVPVGEISAKFHNMLAEIMVAVARRTGEERVILTGGCFQNRYLTERAVARLRAEGFRPYWHQRVPPNDGGIALGQVMAALRAWGEG